MKTVEEYLLHLESKGFIFGEDSVGFIYFGQRYTNASDELTNTAIELTLKAQRKFDGSFYISLLEMLISNQIENRRQAIQFVKETQLLAI
ncbi:DUF6123 family protein [Bacillus massilinigeriensis]|uniref:DUF6123 family protein n=1 Tax=Bacillus massilionigeriensis TaxID=1805475 RepID=UPI00096B64F5|nr:DUF6123 family protein [Bacillus massilionigeriensis]